MFDVLTLKLKKSGRFASFLTSLSLKKGSLAALLRFGCCQVLTLRMPRRIASFSSLQVDR